MTTPAARLAQLGIDLPPVTPPLAAYVPAVRVGTSVWVSGQLPMTDGALAATGLVGDGPGEVSPGQAAGLARLCAIGALAALAGAIGGPDPLAQVTQIVKLTGYVASAPGFTGQPAVINGASELLRDVFGQAGMHARSAVGVAALPLGAPVELDLVAEISGAVA